LGIFVSFVCISDLVSCGDLMKIVLTESGAKNKKYTVHEHVQFTDLVPVFDAEVSGSFLVSRKKEEIYDLEGEFTAVIVTGCDRCGCRIEFNVGQDFFYQYRLGEEPELEPDHDGTDENCEIVYTIDPLLESSEILKEQILLAMPQQSLCGEQCKGLCDQCGINLNENQCKCKENSDNSPFAILRKLQNN